MDNAGLIGQQGVVAASHAVDMGRHRPLHWLRASTGQGEKPGRWRRHIRKSWSQVRDKHLGNGHAGIVIDSDCHGGFFSGRF